MKLRTGSEGGARRFAQRQRRGPGLDHERSFAAAHSMLACVDGELRVLAVNPAWVDGFGAVARSLEVLIHPADRLRVAAALAGVAAGAAGEVTGRFAMRDGGYRALTLRAIRGRAGLHLSARDVEGPHAELAEVKRRLAAVYETMQELAYTTDERGS